MSLDENLSSIILSNTNIIANVYGIVQYAGLKATQSKEVRDSKNDTCVIKPYVPGQNRVTADCVKTNKYAIEYNASDIMIVGGAALNIYDYKLTEFKARHKFSPLEEYIKKKTSDIDIVWWPRPDTNEEIITSKSEAIGTLVRVFKEQLTFGFEKNREILEKRIKPYIKNSSNADRLIIDISSFHTWKAGVFNISITFQIKGIILKICDVVIHDSGSSQRFDEDGQEITDLQFMTDDPVYCSPNPKHSNAFVYLNVNGINIAVPNIWSFVEQQIFAFDNLVRAKQVKSFINYKRVEFIKSLLINFKLNNASNKRNYKNLIEVIKTDNPELIKIILNKINSRIDNSIYKNNLDILQLCSTVNTSKDAIIEELCNKSYILSKIPEIISEELEELRIIKERIIKKSRQTNMSQIKKSYDDLVEEIDRIQGTLQTKTPIEIYQTEYLKGQPSIKIQSLEKEINNANKYWKDKREANIRRNRETRKASMRTFVPPLPSQPPLPPSSMNYYPPYYPSIQPPPPLPVQQYSTQSYSYPQYSMQPQMSYQPMYYRGGQGRRNRTVKK